MNLTLHTKYPKPPIGGLNIQLPLFPFDHKERSTKLYFWELLRPWTEQLPSEVDRITLFSCSRFRHGK